MAIRRLVGVMVPHCWVVGVLLGCGGKTSSIVLEPSLGGSGGTTVPADAAGAPPFQAGTAGNNDVLSQAPLPNGGAGRAGAPLDGTGSATPAGSPAVAVNAGTSGTAGQSAWQSGGRMSSAGSGASTARRIGINGGIAGTPSGAGGTAPRSEKPVLANNAQPTKLTLSVNVEDGFAAPQEDEVFEIDFGTCEVEYSHQVQRELPQNAVVQATEAQCESITDLLSRTTYSGRGDCEGFKWFIDGSPFPPRITVVVAGTASTYSAAKNECVSSDHSTTAPVISCGGYASLVELVNSIVGTTTPTYCLNYW